MEKQRMQDASAAYSVEAWSVSAKDVPPGYKRTEVGVIPEDWDVVSVGELAKTFSGGTPSTTRPEYYGGDIPWITSSDLNHRTIREPEGRITRLGLEKSSAKVVEPGTLVIALYGATAGVSAITYVRAAINQAVLAIVTKSSDSRFLLSVLSFKKDDYVENLTQGGQPNLSGALVRSIKVPIPPKEEQLAISTSLSDADALIESLDGLIAKKGAIKQAAMQQLLTGKIRLPGFTGEWETKRLGDHVAFLKTGTNSRAELSSHGSVAYLHYGDIHVGASVRLDPKAVTIPRIASSKVRHLGQLEVGDLVFVDASEDLEGVGKSVEIADLPPSGIVAGLHTIAARFDKAVLADGFKAYLQFCPGFIGTLRRLAAGTKVLATNRRHIASVEMALPDVSEQRAIADTLADMDTEIEALEHRRDKARQIKQGMMQQLLTGRVRLVASEAP